jgi:CheY-like chemotaxis protein
VTTILHVEDDPMLATMVQEAFEAFGFRGNYVVATTVAEAQRILQGVPGPNEPDFIICDLHLPDGTGLDVVKHVRTDPARRHVPIVILSGSVNDVDRSIVNRAYVLGANSYIDKVRGRSMTETMWNLYAYWLRDARLPSRVEATRTFRYAARAAGIRMRFASVYLQIAENLGHPDGEIWMDLALREGNFANLLTFLSSQLGGREIPEDVLAAGEAAQRVQAELVATLEQQGVRTRDEADRYMLVMTSNIQAETIARAIAQFFPVVPVAMSALRESGAEWLERLAGWIETHSSDRQLLHQVGRLRADAARIRSLSIAGAAREVLQ